MISFLLATGLTVTPPVYHAPSGQQGHLVTTQAEDSFKIGKFLENNWVFLLGGIIFLIRLQNSVEDIKKDNQNKIELLSKDFELIKFSLNELREQIDKTAGTAKEDVRRVSVRVTKHQQKLDKLIDLINHDRSVNGKSPFVIDSHSSEDDF
jgi:hypothetical protein